MMCQVLCALRAMVSDYSRERPFGVFARLYLFEEMVSVSVCAWKTPWRFESHGCGRYALSVRRVLGDRVTFTTLSSALVVSLEGALLPEQSAPSKRWLSSDRMAAMPVYMLPDVDHSVERDVEDLMRCEGGGLTSNSSVRRASALKEVYRTLRTWSQTRGWPAYLAECSRRGVHKGLLDAFQREGGSLTLRLCANALHTMCEDEGVLRDVRTHACVDTMMQEMGSACVHWTSLSRQRLAAVLRLVATVVRGASRDAQHPLHDGGYAQVTNICTQLMRQLDHDPQLTTHVRAVMCAV